MILAAASPSINLKFVAGFVAGFALAVCIADEDLRFVEQILTNIRSFLVFFLAYFLPLLLGNV